MKITMIIYKLIMKDINILNALIVNVHFIEIKAHLKYIIIFIILIVKNYIY